MFPIQIDYQVTLSDFRKATYYGLVVRYRRALLIMLIVLAVGILYAIGAAAGLGQPNYLVFFLAAAYLIWGLLLFAGAERGIKRYIKSPDSLVGCDYTAVFEEHHVCFRIPKRHINASYHTDRLACVFELSSMLLVYVSSQDVFPVPKRALSEEQLVAVRKNFRVRLGERFSSRFEKKA